MSSFDQLVNAQLSEKAYNDYDQTNVDKATTSPAPHCKGFVANIYWQREVAGV